MNYDPGKEEVNYIKCWISIGVIDYTAVVWAAILYHKFVFLYLLLNFYSS